jgi:hypothetical protein
MARPQVSISHHRPTSVDDEEESPFGKTTVVFHNEDPCGRGAEGETFGRTERRGRETHAERGSEQVLNAI